MAVNARIGLAASNQGGAGELFDEASRAEERGVATLWLNAAPLGPDTPTLLAAAAIRTGRIGLGTAIVPAFIQHPVKLATQVLVIEGVSPGRLRLGIGTSHEQSMVGLYHLPFDRPLARLREHLHVLRTLLHEGEVSFAGEFYAVDAALPDAPATPVLISALRPSAFALAGEASDGAISWLCPFDYLRREAKPALARAAAAADRAVPPLIAHVPVVVAPDRATGRARARSQLAFYGTLPFYAQMFAEAGFPVDPAGGLTDALIDDVVVGGDEGAIAAGLRERLAQLDDDDELLVGLLAGPDRRADEDALLRALAAV